MRGLHRRDLHRPRQPLPAGAGRPRARRAAHPHHRSGELPRLPGRDPGAGARRSHAEAGGTVRRGVQDGNGRLRRPFEAALHRPDRGERIPRPHPDRRHRRLGPPARAGIGEEAHGARRIHLRHLRRGVLPRHGGRRRRRRGHGLRGGDLPHPVRVEGSPGPPARPVPRVEDPGGPGPRGTRRSSSSSTPSWRTSSIPRRTRSPGSG